MVTESKCRKAQLKLPPRSRTVAPSPPVIFLLHLHDNNVMLICPPPLTVHNITVCPPPSYEGGGLTDVGSREQDCIF